MSSQDPEELELQALQRQLDDAFETTRPRSGFEDELWLRMQQRRPVLSRLQDAFAGLVAGFRDAPALPTAAVALLLIVVVGVGVLNSGLSPFRANHGSLSTTSGGALAPGPENAYQNGKVPTPVLHPGLVDSTALPVSVGLDAPAFAAASDLYFGPANLTWTGTFPSGTAQAPVLIYAEPTPDQSAGAKAAFGSTAGLSVITRASLPQLPREPIFVIAELNPGVNAGTDPTAAASDFLAAHNLLPSWPNNVVVIQSGGVMRVVYQRGFAAADGSTVYLVNWNGERYGIEVDIFSGRRVAAGPLPLGLQSSTYPLISNAQAAQLAVSEPAPTDAAITPTPTIKLDHVELVYALAISGQYGFYEPAYLFTGTFQYNGQTWVKRVLVPLVVPAQRS